jgi:hypothetical protein
MIEQQLCFVDFVGNPRSKLSDNTCFANFLEPWTDQQIDIGHLPLSCGVQSSCSLIDIVCLLVVESFFLAANKKNKIACLLYVSLLHLRSLALKLQLLSSSSSSSSSCSSSSSSSLMEGYLFQHHRQGDRSGRDRGL